METNLKDNEILNKLHWDDEKKQYSDFGLHSHKVVLVDKRVKSQNGQYEKIKVRDQLELPYERLVPHTGYIQAGYKCPVYRSKLKNEVS